MPNHDTKTPPVALPTAATADQAMPVSSVAFSNCPGDEDGHNKGTMADRLGSYSPDSISCRAVATKMSVGDCTYTAATNTQAVPAPTKSKTIITCRRSRASARAPPHGDAATLVRSRTATRAPIKVEDEEDDPMSCNAVKEAK
eukprot:scaffold37077_cov328-Amphora_coffeaeformis.AAC.1